MHWIFWILFVFLAILYFIPALIFTKHDPQEPPLAGSRISVIGNLLGLLRHRISYLKDLASRIPDPAFTISLLNYKIYVLTDPSLISAIHRNKDVSFEPILVEIAASVIGDAPNILKLMRDPKPGSGVRNPYNDDTRAVLHSTMTSGSSFLYSMNDNVLGSIARLVNRIGDDYKEKVLWEWVRDSFTEATSEAIYGMHHPIGQDKSLTKAVWDFEQAQISLMMLPNFLQRILPWTQRSLKSQKRLQRAFARYYSDPVYYFHKTASSLSKRQTEVNLKHNVPLTDIGNSALSLLFVGTTNAIPTVHWAILHLFSRPDLVDALRDQIVSSGIITEVGRTIAARRFRIDHSQFETKVPLLTWIYKETMRLTNVQPGARYVLEDTSIRHANTNREYLLKKGSLILTPASIVHTSPSIWGPDPLAFRPGRWMHETNKMRRAFIPFGGGIYLCPGRDLAYAEIVGTLAVLAMGFDVMGADGDLVKVPVGGEAKFGVLGPDKEGMQMGVMIKRRMGYENVLWEFGDGLGEKNAANSGFGGEQGS